MSSPHLSEPMFFHVMFISKSSAFCIYCPSLLPVVWPSLCISISCLVCHWLRHSPGVSHCMSRYRLLSVLFILSLTILLGQIIMYLLSYFPALFCLISRFDPFCVPWLLFLESVFSIVLTHCFWTLFGLLTSAHGLPFCFVVLIGLIPSFDPLPVTPFMIWITCVITVCWNNDPVYGHSHCHWIIYITPIFARKTRFCFTLPEENKDTFLFIVVFAFGSLSASSDTECHTRRRFFDELKLYWINKI